MSDGPAYELGGRGDPTLSGLPPLVRAQVTQQIQQHLLTEIVEQAGGEVVLPPGFRDRIGFERTVETKFLDDGSYRIRAVQMPPEIVHIGIGTRWERMEGPLRKGQERCCYEVVEEADGAGYAGLQAIDTAGEVQRKPVLKVSAETLRLGGGGWRPMRMPLEVIEGLAGTDGGGAIG